VSVHFEMNKFVHPSTILISGPTGSGKTELTIKLFLEKRFVFPKNRPDGRPNPGRPDRIIWVYGQWQHLYDTLREIAKISPEITGQIEFKEEIDESLVETLNTNENNFLVLDDQMSRLNNNPILTRLFTEVSHHRNTTVIMLLQNLFIQGKEMVTVSRNAHYLVPTRNPRDFGSVSRFMQQVNPVGWKTMVAAYTDATRKPFSHCKLNLQTGGHEHLMITGSALRDDCTVYVLPGVRVHTISHCLDDNDHEVDQGELFGKNQINYDEGLDNHYT
jgi:hypothetical protein